MVFWVQNGLCATAAKETAVAASCAPKGVTQAKAVSINDRLELTLADGRVLRIAGIEAPAATPSDPDLGIKARDWLAAWLENQTIFYGVLDERPDRWGRYAAVVFAARVSDDASSQGTSLVPAGESLAGQGFARVVPDQHKLACGERLLQAEKAARTAGLGLWSDPYYAVVSATDVAAFEEHAGSFILAEGQLTEVRDAPARMTLFFGPRRRTSLAVTILQRNVKIFEAAGLHFHDLIGQTLRVRGLLEMRFGPEIELTNPSEVERITDAPGETAKPAQKAPAVTRP